MLDTRSEFNNSSFGAFDVGKAESFIEEGFDHVHIAFGETHFAEELEDGVVGDAVEGFVEVDEEDIVHFSVFHSTVEFFVEEVEVSFNRAVSPESILVVREDGFSGGSDAFADGV